MTQKDSSPGKQSHIKAAAFGNEQGQTNASLPERSGVRELSLPYDGYLSERVRSQIEQRYYAKIDTHGQLEQLLNDCSFTMSPQGHSSLFADHGIFHVRDVATQILQVLDRANGMLIPARDPARLEFMKGYGVQLTYIHDIGLCDLSTFGRKMHAYAVAQLVLSPALDDLLKALWTENAGNVPHRLTNLSTLEQDPCMVAREMLALAICHSKSAIPVQVLNSPHRLRRALQRCAVIDLHDFYDRIRESHSNTHHSDSEAGPTFALETIEGDAMVSPERMDCLERYYEDFGEEGFRWLIDETAPIRELTQDVVDTLRALRCADALRQRGTSLKTSGNYEIFVDRKTGNAIYALRKKEQKLILLELHDPISAGEANLASCELTQEGDLRASFHRGAFADTATIQRAASNAARVLDDIQSDVILSFQRGTPEDDRKNWEKDCHEMHILLESVEDNPDFASLVKEQLLLLHPTLQNTVRVVPSLKNVSALERRFYLEGDDLAWDVTEKRKTLERLALSGHKTRSIDLDLAFQDVKFIELQKGQTLIEAGAPPGFVYIPLTEGLKIIPLGGYPSFRIQPWMPLGITGVIRGAARNATVIAEEVVNLLMIPQERYLKHWHHTYDLDEFIQWMHAERRTSGATEENPSSRDISVPHEQAELSSTATRDEPPLKPSHDRQADEAKQ